MTEELTLTITSVFAPKFPPELHFKPQNSTLRDNRALYKRHITQKWV